MPLENAQWNFETPGDFRAFAKEGCIANVCYIFELSYGRYLVLVGKQSIERVNHQEA